MSAPRFFVPEPLGAADVGRELALPEGTAHHALRTLRLVPGDALTLFAGTGGEFAATLMRTGKREATARLDRFVAIDRESPVVVTLIQGIAASDAFDYLVRKSVELGVAAIQPVTTERSAPLPAGERTHRRLAHWRQIVVAACEQCGRNRIPPVHDVQPLPAWLAQRQSGRTGIVLSPDTGQSLASLAAVPTELDVLVGPEGGLADQEIERATRAGLQRVRLGPRVLRTETAGPAVLAAINTLWGDFR